MAKKEKKFNGKIEGFRRTSGGLLVRVSMEKMSFYFSIRVIH